MLSSLRFRAVVLGLAGVLALPSLAEESPSARAASRLTFPAASDTSLLAEAWSWLQSVLPNSGCGLDPSGPSCRVLRRRPGTESGCGIGPSGPHCPVPAPSPGTNEGCGIDPSGSTTCASGGTAMQMPMSKARARHQARQSATLAPSVAPRSTSRNVGAPTPTKPDSGQLYCLTWNMTALPPRAAVYTGYRASFLPRRERAHREVGRQLRYSRSSHGVLEAARGIVQARGLTKTENIP